MMRLVMPSRIEKLFLIELQFKKVIFQNDLKNTKVKCYNGKEKIPA